MHCDVHTTTSLFIVISHWLFQGTLLAIMMLQSLQKVVCTWVISTRDQRYGDHMKISQSTT